MNKQTEDCLNYLYRSENDHLEYMYERSSNAYEFSYKLRSFWEKLLIELTEDDGCPLSDKELQERLYEISFLSIAKDYFQGMKEQEEMENDPDKFYMVKD